MAAPIPVRVGSAGADQRRARPGGAGGASGADRRRARHEHARRAAPRRCWRPWRRCAWCATCGRSRAFPTAFASRSSSSCRSRRSSSSAACARRWRPTASCSGRRCSPARCRPSPAAPSPRPASACAARALLAALAVLGAAPAPLARLVERVFTGAQGLTVAMRNGLLVYFGDATRPHAKWLSLARVLADPSSAGASYVDVRLPSRPAAGFPAGVTPPNASAADRRWLRRSPRAALNRPSRRSRPACRWRRHCVAEPAAEAPSPGTAAPAPRRRGAGEPASAEPGTGASGRSELRRRDRSAPVNAHTGGLTDTQPQLEVYGIPSTILRRRVESRAICNVCCETGRAR